MKRGNKIAEIVASTGETVNIADAYEDSRFDPQVFACSVDFRIADVYTCKS